MVVFIQAVLLPFKRLGTIPLFRLALPFELLNQLSQFFALPRISKGRTIFAAMFVGYEKKIQWR